MNDVARRLRAVVGTVHSPTEVWLLLRMLLWAVALPTLKVRIPLERLVALMWLGRRARPRSRDPVSPQRVARLSRLAHRLSTANRRDNCLERSLLAYRHLSGGAADPVLVIGTRVGAEGVEGHVWVTAHGQPLHDRPEDIATFVPVTAFGAGGRRQPVT